MSTCKTYLDCTRSGKKPSMILKLPYKHAGTGIWCCDTPKKAQKQHHKKVAGKQCHRNWQGSRCNDVEAVNQ
jgi:hypothetical protein